MSECDRIERILERWEGDAGVSGDELALFRSHLAACPRCADRFGALGVLVERDANPAPLPAVPFDGRLADKIMARVRSTTPRRFRPLLSWSALAAACLLVAVGIGIGVVVTRTSLPADEVTVRFEVDAPGAESVALVGNFSDWNPSKLEMTDANHDGTWQITIRLHRNSLAIYNFVIDGTRWIADPRSTAQVDNGFGGLSSVIRL